jgi:hypothetical protein
MFVIQACLNPLISSFLPSLMNVGLLIISYSLDSEVNAIEIKQSSSEIMLMID